MRTTQKSERREIIYLNDESECTVRPKCVRSRLQQVFYNASVGRTVWSLDNKLGSLVSNHLELNHFIGLDGDEVNPFSKCSMMVRLAFDTNELTSDHVLALLS